MSERILDPDGMNPDVDSNDRIDAPVDGTPIPLDQKHGKAVTSPDNEPSPLDATTPDEVEEPDEKEKTPPDSVEPTDEPYMPLPPLV